ncbi:ARM repeat-containing protein [Aulographum hederae CBS 113979]|uniref:ARM repeat-containing protein n=1 Tax=Aulographum hederae CBS 113979 TaxID=1176131 RepID=A0A6G1GUR1_9PEZI|nr:ARM repeat-containing protein [Aulographum hederae CBS 113979]
MAGVKRKETSDADTVSKSKKSKTETHGKPSKASKSSMEDGKLPSKDKVKGEKKENKKPKADGKENGVKEEKSHKTNGKIDKPAKESKSKKDKSSKKDKRSEDKKKEKKSKRKPEVEEDELVESDTTEDDNGGFGFSAKLSDDDEEFDDDDEMDVDEEGGVPLGQPVKDVKKSAPEDGKKKEQYGTPTQKKMDLMEAERKKEAGIVSSKEAHAKQKALAKERKASKPNADEVARAKKLWERLRRKSHVESEERKKLVNELYDIITGRIKDFVFKHDSVRVIQCALKYANSEQRKIIATELQGEWRGLAENKYAKFLLAKIMVEGGPEICAMIITEFYGHVKKLINHPEGGWILDDIYRAVATPAQKARMLREWYSPEFAVFGDVDEAPKSLAEILEAMPEKRNVIMKHLHGLINQLVQKKSTGFTMLHDAMLQYFLNTKPGTEEATEFLEMMKGEEEVDLMKNLAFTDSGSRVVCLAVAYGSAKDRRAIPKAYKDTMELLAFDKFGYRVLLTALEVIDDTKLTGKAIFPELVTKGPTPDVQQETIITLATHLHGRIPLLQAFSGTTFLVRTASPQDLPFLESIYAIRNDTSKKDPEIRRQELAKQISQPLLDTIAAHATELAKNTLGCYFITEVLIASDPASSSAKAVDAVAALAAGDPAGKGHIATSVGGGKMFKTLALGGRFDPKTKAVVPVESPLGFADKLWPHVKEYLVQWATGPSSLVVTNMLDAGDFEKREEMVKALRGVKGTLEGVAEGGEGMAKGVVKVLERIG